jgi:hypothetical protein
LPHDSCHAQNARVKRRWIVIAMALLAGAAFAMSVQLGPWWTMGACEIGPYGAHDCLTPTSGLAWLGGARYERIGMATWGAGLLAMLALIVVAARLAARKVPRIAAKFALVSVATAAAVGIAFVALFPRAFGASIDRGIPLFVAGIVLGAAATLPIIRAK